jgi:ATP-dependent helicase/nuclease subunit B
MAGIRSLLRLSSPIPPIDPNRFYWPAMLHTPLLIKPCAAFWEEVARTLVKSELLFDPERHRSNDLSVLQVVVPTVAHVQLLKTALAKRLEGTCLPPRITTLAAWRTLALPTVVPACDSERLMALYAELRQHAWLKKLFSARRNTDLLPLARTLLSLSDELTEALFPAFGSIPDAADARWQAALMQLSPSARTLLSDEAQMVWSIWKSQLDERDPSILRFSQMMDIADHADQPLVWISPVAPDAFEAAFLARYGERQTVLPVTLDWRARTTDPLLCAAWPDLADDDDAFVSDSVLKAPASLALCETKGLEDEAQRAAQTAIDWLAAGKSCIAIVAQDRVVARRIRALLERAQVRVSDETGWKLSTTRAAAAIAAWFELVVSRAESGAVLDVLKSPFIFADTPDRADKTMAIELALRRNNVTGSWRAVDAALSALPDEQLLVRRMAQQAEAFGGRSKRLAEWVATTRQAIDGLAMRDPLAADVAGAQVLALLDSIERDCRAMVQPFSFAEWRTFISLQLECTAFKPDESDKRVVMLPLNGAHLRTFDAVLVVGADAEHLPSKPVETLFFANAVRRELGLDTREGRQRQQLRDFAELLLANDTVVVSWQAHKDGEPNPVSPWIARLQMTLERAHSAPLARHCIALPQISLAHAPAARPAPSAPQLLPTKLSASGYNSFVACPYQFFATRMLGLSTIDELSEMPEKRDYGDWLHQILRLYHEAVRDRHIALDARAALLSEISDQVFERELQKSAAALGYYARWQKAAPAYLAWANERERQGWQFMLGEAHFEKKLEWPGGEITLHGRIDRIDGNDAGERAVLDYKTRSQSSLSGKFRQLEDHQLAFYGMLSDAPVDAAHYVALEPTKDKAGDAAAPNYAQWKSMLGKHIVDSLQAISQGAALQANGIEGVCQYCDVRGLCRKGAW